MKNYIYFSILVLLITFFSFTLRQGIQKSIENQDTMLCESAKISGNVQWLQKCKCYYAGENINCISKKYDKSKK